MAKKAKQVSWRTLTRKADKAAEKGQLRQAAALRKQAHELRRAERKKVKKAAPAARRNIVVATRAARGWATRRANEVKKAMKAGGLAARVAEAPSQQQGINRAPTTMWQASVMQQAEDARGLPGQGELVGGEISKLADELVKLARKKGGTDAVQNKLLAIRATAHYAGCVETDTAATKRLIDVQQVMADRIVCGFLAEVDCAMQQYRGLPPAMVWNLNSYTVTKIIDALNKAGYRSTGKT